MATSKGLDVYNLQWMSRKSTISTSLGLQSLAHTSATTSPYASECNANIIYGIAASNTFSCEAET